MRIDWKEMLENKTLKEIQRSIGKMASYYATNFSVADFFDATNSPDIERKAVIVITPNQVMIGAMPFYKGTVPHRAGMAAHTKIL